MNLLHLGSLLLDWSRMSQKAGGLSVALESILEFIASGRFFDARKLAFAQQLISGVPDEGSWGGMAKSDISVRVKSRNQECCNVLSNFLSELTISANESSVDASKEKKIAVLYGAYHIKDLITRFSRLDLEYIPNDRYLTAWTLNRSNKSPDNIVKDITLGPNLRQSDILIALTSVIYLFVGAVDWLLLLRAISESIQTFLPQSDINYANSAFLFVYITLYFQRHLWLQTWISSFCIQWDRGLFE